MQAGAIRAAAANFRNASKSSGRWRSAATCRARCSTSCCRGVTPDLRIMDLLDSQPEFTKAPWEYLDILVTDARIADGRAILAQAQREVRRDGENLRRRSPCHRGDLGHRIELQHA